MSGRVPLRRKDWTGVDAGALTWGVTAKRHGPMMSLSEARSSPRNALHRWRAFSEDMFRLIHVKRYNRLSIPQAACYKIRKPC